MNLCKDDIKEILGDTIGFADRKKTRNFREATIELMIHVFNQSAKVKNDLILEADFHENELLHLHCLASEYHYEVLTLELRGDIEILHKRYLNRMKNENRNPVHLTTTFDVFEDFKEYTEISRAEKIPGRIVKIDASDFDYQKDEALLNQIDRFMRE